MATISSLVQPVHLLNSLILIITCKDFSIYVLFCLIVITVLEQRVFGA